MDGIRYDDTECGMYLRSVCEKWKAGLNKNIFFICCSVFTIYSVCVRCAGTARDVHVLPDAQVNLRSHAQQKEQRK